MEGQIKKLLAAYTSYVSMGSTDKVSSEKMDARLKRNMSLWMSWLNTGFLPIFLTKVEKRNLGNESPYPAVIG